jgi:hypothetical protein
MKEMLCRGCGSTRNVPTERDVTKHACDICNGHMTHEAIDYDLTDLTDAQRDFLRSCYQTVIVRDNDTVGTFHIPSSNGGPLCASLESWKEKDLAVYPMGYSGWCSLCLSKASHKKAHSGKKGYDTTKRSCIEAIKRARVRVGHWPSYGDYRELGMTPSVETIRRRFDGGWAEAKSQAKSES